MGVLVAVCGLFVPYVTGVVSDKILLRATMLQNKLQADLTDTINCLGEYLSLGAAQRQQEHLAHSQTQITTLQCYLAAQSRNVLRNSPRKVLRPWPLKVRLSTSWAKVLSCQTNKTAAKPPSPIAAASQPLTRRVKPVSCHSVVGGVLRIA